MNTKMKTLYVVGFLLTISVSLSGQMNSNVLTMGEDLPAFNQVHVSGSMEVKLHQSDTYFLQVDAEEKYHDEITMDVRNGVLTLENKSKRSAPNKKIHASVGLPHLAAVKAGGAVKIIGEGTFRGDFLRIDAGGATSVKLLIDYEEVESKISGASRLTLDGTAGKHSSEISGASKLEAKGLKTGAAYITASGASKAHVFALDYLETKTSGSAKIQVDKKPDVWHSNNQMIDLGDLTDGKPFTDTTRMKIGRKHIEIIDGDSVKISIGSRSVVIDEKGNVNVERKRKHKFNGHWAGFELGFNGLLTPNFDMNYAKEDAYLDLRMEKSINVNLNFFEQNIPLNKRNTFGMVTGLGFSWNNYRFGNNVFITPDSLELKGYYMEGVEMRKSKITNLYLTLPLMFEVQSRAVRKRDKLHLSVGVVGGWRIRTHTKLYYEEANKDFWLRDPASGELLPNKMSSPGGSSRIIDKNHDSFHMRPFKLDASVRAGWGVIQLYANYSLFSLFIDDRGPELYPISVGISLTPW